MRTPFTKHAKALSLFYWISLPPVARLGVVLWGVGSTAVAAQSFYDFDIKQQSAHLALTEFARQANITLLFPFDIAQQQIANSVQGKYSLQEGITELLKGTNLQPVTDPSGMLSVKVVTNTVSQSPSSASSVPAQNKNTYTEDPFEKIAIVGTRGSARSMQRSAVPLDILSADELRSAGATDALTILSSLVPSLNVNDQPINDASTLVKPANLRGLASDHTLVLLNGKRYHRSAVITFLGGGLSDGAQGPDISTIPMSAINQVEILRDGAAAQYGSDAIAGVINFNLKDSDEGGSLIAHYGGFFEGDGSLVHLQANKGLSLFDDGFLNVTAEYRKQNPTDRSVQRQDALSVAAAGNEFVPDPAQVWGAPRIDYDVKTAGHFAVKDRSDNELYGFFNLSKREVTGGFYYRHPHTKKQVYDGGENEYAEPLLLIGDLDGIGRGVSCPEVVINDGNVLDDADYALIADQSTAIGQNCFAFNELFPGGFTPKFGGVLKDTAVYLGYRLETDNQWLVDLHGQIGRSKVTYNLSNTINPSLGPATPLSFNAGAAAQREMSLNMDVTREIDLASGSVNLASGLGWRSEQFSQQAGEPASYIAGPLARDPVTGESQGFGVGANGFIGYRPSAAGTWKRHNWSLYSDIEFEPSEAFLLGLAARYEYYTDFGSTFDGKLSALVSLSDVYAIRGSVSSGFKAPTVGQSNIINVTTAFFSGQLQEQITLPPSNLVAQAMGAKPLAPEESSNISVGWVATVSPSLFITFDYFNIRMTDRISTTSALPLSEVAISSLLSQGLEGAENFSSAKYFTNDFDTRTQGVDIFAQYDVESSFGNSELSLMYNWTDTDVQGITSYLRQGEDGEFMVTANLTAQRINMLETNLPEHRATLNFKHGYADWLVNIRLNYYGTYYEDHLDASANYDIFAGSEWTSDVELTYALSEHAQFTAGARNLFDNRPDKNPFSHVVGAMYPVTSPMGINGGFYYLRALYEF